MARRQMRSSDSKDTAQAGEKRSNKKNTRPDKNALRGGKLSRLPKRMIIQISATLIQNGNLKGFLTGSLYRGQLKKFCVPGLNCYSCPGALGACPIGAIQALGISPHFGASYYVYGMLLLIGVLFGRLVCAFLCPFGLIQELLYKIPVKKLREKPPIRKLLKLKYAVLLIFVIALPTAIMLGGGVGFPAFCKWICPAGTLGAGFPMMISNARLRKAIAMLFVWKVSVLVLVVVAAVKIFRPFCKYLCPLGAIYALFNKISVLYIKTDDNLCRGCGACVKVCKMQAADTDDPECIRCGECVTKCNTKAKKWSTSRR